jgi:hypothetical protein
MKTEYLPDSTLAVSGTTRVEKFNKIWAGIGWPDREDGYICVAGERLDGRYHCMWEKPGGLWELGEAAVEAKDRFLVDRIWVDAGDELSTSYLRTLDGLSFYDEEDDYPDGSWIPARPASRRDHFRDLGTVATVSPIPERIAANYRSALETIKGLVMKGGLIIHESNCPRLLYVLRQPLQEMLASPVTKGLAWVIAALEISRGVSGAGLDEHSPWYGNLPREK